MLASALLVAVVAVLGWAYRDDLWGWFVGYRVWWTPAGMEVVDVNRHGVAAVYRHVVDLETGRGVRREVGLWNPFDGSFVRLDADDGPAPYTIVAVNREGDVVGYEGDHRLVLGTSAVSRQGFGDAVLWRRSGETVRIESPTGRVALPSDLNDRGQVVGTTFRIRPGGELGPATTGRAFLWSADTGFVDLHSRLDRERSQAIAINNHGWIVGSWSREPRDHRPFLWVDGKAKDLIGQSETTLGAVPVAINDRGEVVLHFAGPWLDQVFLWSPKSGIRRVPDPELSGWHWMSALGILPDGTVLLQGYKAPDSPAEGLALQSFSDQLTFEEPYFVYRRGKPTRLPDMNATDLGATTYRSLAAGGWLAGNTQGVGIDGRLGERGFLLRLYR